MSEEELSNDATLKHLMELKYSKDMRDLIRDQNSKIAEGKNMGLKSTSSLMTLKLPERLPGNNQNRDDLLI